jgi:hypothetical protein
MSKIIIFLVIHVFSIATIAQEKSKKNTEQVKKVIEVFFEGLHKGDSTIMKSTFHKNIKIQTTYTNKDEQKVLQTESIEKILTIIANKKKEDIYLEKLHSYDIKIDGNLASVWTPYEFYFNGKFSHCGANSFQLFNNNGNWQIIYLVDMRRRESCKVLKEKN